MSELIERFKSLCTNGKYKKNNSLTQPFEISLKQGLTESNSLTRGQLLEKQILEQIIRINEKTVYHQLNGEYRKDVCHIHGKFTLRELEFYRSWFKPEKNKLFYLLYLLMP